MNQKDIFKTNDSITSTAGGAYIEHTAKNLLSNPENISSKVDKETFYNLIEHLYSETNNPHKRKQENGKNKKDKRRPLKFFEKVLMFFFWF